MGDESGKQLPARRSFQLGEERRKGFSGFIISFFLILSRFANLRFRARVFGLDRKLRDLLVDEFDSALGGHRRQQRTALLPPFTRLAHSIKPLRFHRHG